MNSKFRREEQGYNQEEVKKYTLTMRIMFLSLKLDDEYSGFHYTNSTHFLKSETCFNIFKNTYLQSPKTSAAITLASGTAPFQWAWSFSRLVIFIGRLSSVRQEGQPKL